MFACHGCSAVHVYRTCTFLSPSLPTMTSRWCHHDDDVTMPPSHHARLRSSCLASLLLPWRWWDHAPSFWQLQMLLVMVVVMVASVPVTVPVRMQVQAIELPWVDASCMQWMCTGR